ncbi:50S ribosomal protein L17 [Desulfonatronum sp. SC1]|uniref:50S ribosomal protein L17 n=1 Tax=Desulfonatronum sp. SC1 TaxID=2109626 RepID=UPI000D2F8927|nr:50S ribosomal protein L17 [Desulfonatronum sp. SC1]PTN37347.1 50S ribosomal protein L17 [Desulfonatronum sp. SC1]
MRHRKSGRKFNRTPAHRKAMFRNMASALIQHGRIQTTEAKAKELRGVVEKLVTKAKRNDLHSRRLVYKVLGDHGLVKRLFDEIAPLYQDVPGGYTRVLKLGSPRPGDCAPLAFIEFTKHDGVSGQTEIGNSPTTSVAQSTVPQNPATEEASSAPREKSTE